MIIEIQDALHFAPSGIVFVTKFCKATTGESHSQWQTLPDRADSIRCLADVPNRPSPNCKIYLPVLLDGCEIYLYEIEIRP